MKAHPQKNWIERSNAETLCHVERQGRTSPGLVPFLGAGISTAFGFKNWRDLLLHAAPPRLARKIENLLEENDYEGAAEILREDLGSDGFQNLVAASAGDSHLDAIDFRTGTVALLPLLASGPVITTNFDRVLERAFESNGAPFESIISGPRPDLIVDALHGDRRVLIKLHGDWQDRVGRTFAKSDYDENYGGSDKSLKRVLLNAIEQLLFSSRSLLFIGASLGPDRTVRLLQTVHEKYAGIRHFAVMCASTKPNEFDEREKHLRTCGVLPLWYHADTEGFVIVKLNGGIDRERLNPNGSEGFIPESYVTTILAFWDLAARIPDALPAAVQQTLLANPLLFLGHGLAAPDVESLVRFAHRDHPGPRSWAVVLKTTGIDYWQQCGVEILNRRVDTYVSELHHRLSTIGPGVQTRSRTTKSKKKKRSRRLKKK